jgi:beta-lactamase regulating signal transducer with metallopeptidase domain
MAVLLFNLAMVAVALLRRQTGYLAKYSTLALLLLALLGALRLALPLSFQFTHVINSFNIVPSIENFLSTDLWPGAARLELLTVILLIWGAGSLAMVIRIIRSMLKDRYYRKRYRVVESEQVDRIAKALRLKHTKIVVSPDIVMPHVTGFFKARIYLPEIAVADDALELILNHEYQHFKSKDILIKTYYLLLSIVFWWNPINHIFLRELDRLLEIRCDEALTKRMNEDEKTSYMESLLFIAKHIQSQDTARPANASSFVKTGKYGFIEQRFHLILKRRKTHMKIAIQQFLSATLVVIVFLASFMVIIQPAVFPVEYGTEDIFRLSPENAYILITECGRYELYIDGQFFHELTELYLELDDFKDLPRVYED